MVSICSLVDRYTRPSTEVATAIRSPFSGPNQTTPTAATIAATMSLRRTRA
jgi:hypothetical protein